MALILGLLPACQGRHVRTATALAADRPVCSRPREHRPMQPHRPMRPAPAPHAAEALGARAYRTAVRLGIVEVVDEIARLRVRDPADPKRMRRLDPLMQRVRDTVQVASASMQGLVAELECEEELALRIAQELEQGHGRRNTILTAVAIAVGAAAAITAGALALAGRARAGEAVAVGGGSTEAGLGTALLFSRTRSVHLAHPQNHLREVWRGPQAAELLPPFVWAWLEPRGPHESPSPRDRILRRLLDMPPQRRAPHVGDGGLYTASDLHLRAELLDMLEDQIELIYRDLVLLLEQSLALGLPPDHLP